MSAANSLAANAPRLAATVLTACLLGGCMVGPDFTEPAGPAARSYANEAQPATPPALGEAQRFVAGGEVPGDWWRLFHSDELDGLMRDAFADNPGLQAAQAALRESQDNLRAGYGVFFPQAGLAFDATRQNASAAQPGGRAISGIFNLFTLGATVSYALDVFGGQRREVEALGAQVDYQRNVARATWLALSANIVNTLIARAAYREELEATRQLIDLQAQQLDVAKARATAGTVPYSNVLSLESQLATSRAALPPLRQKTDQADHLLATLIGQFPSEWRTAELRLDDFVLPGELPLSLPSSLVRQRPDILQAEAQMHAASAEIGVATAAMFPSFSLTGSYGGASTALGGLSAADNRFWSVGPSVDLPLFQGGALLARRQAAVDAYEKSAGDYRGTVLSAFAQVADTLKALRHDAESLAAYDDALASAKQALDLVQANFKAGLVGYLDVLVADELYHQARIARIQASAQRYQDTSALFVALGGGWWHGDPEGGAP